MSQSFKSDTKSVDSSLEVKEDNAVMSPKPCVHKKLLIDDHKPVGYEQLDYVIIREIKRGTNAY